MEKGNFGELVDPRLENNFVHREMVRMVACASASIRHSARRRPKMRQVSIPLLFFSFVYLLILIRTSKFDLVNSNLNSSKSQLIQIKNRNELEIIKICNDLT